MQYVLAYGLSVCMLLIIFYVTTIRVTLFFKREDKDDQLLIHVKFWCGLLHFKYEASIIQFSRDFSGIKYQTEMESADQPLDQKNFKINPKELITLQQRIYHFIQRIHDLHRVIRRCLKTIKIEKIRWQSTLGTGDAADTGMYTGMLWGIKSSVLGVLSSYFSFQKLPHINVEPSYQEKKLNTYLTCMFHLKFGHAILAGIRVLLNLRKRRDATWKNTQYKA